MGGRSDESIPINTNSNKYDIVPITTGHLVYKISCAK